MAWINGTSLAMPVGEIILIPKGKRAKVAGSAPFVLLLHMLRAARVPNLTRASLCRLAPLPLGGRR
jgi:hypothetical protein